MVPGRVVRVPLRRCSAALLTYPSRDPRDPAALVGSGVACCALLSSLVDYGERALRVSAIVCYSRAYGIG